MLYQLKKEAVTIIHDYREKEEVLERVIRLMCDVYHLPDFNEVFNLIIERESKLSTGIGLGIAVPHCRLDSIKRIIAGAVLVTRGVDYNAVDSQPVKLIFAIISPVSDIRGHLACLSSVSHAISDENTRVKLLDSSSKDELYQNIIYNIKY